MENLLLMVSDVTYLQFMKVHLGTQPAGTCVRRFTQAADSILSTYSTCFAGKPARLSARRFVQQDFP